MCFVYSKGCIQIYFGLVKNFKQMEQWFNVLDFVFNLYFNMDEVVKVWIVCKFIVDGIVISLELFDEDGEFVVYFFGVCKLGKLEL